MRSALSLIAGGLVAGALVASPAHAQEPASPEAGPAEGSAAAHEAPSIDPAGAAEAAPPDAVPPRAFYDISMLARLYPEGEATTLGASAGGVYRPMLHSCMHVAAELAFERGERQLEGVDFDALVLRGALGAVWGRGSRDGLWFGAGAMVDLGYARAGRDGLREEGFSSTLALRAMARWRLRGAAFVHADLRVGHTVADELVTLTDGSRFGVGGPVVALSIGASLGP